MKHARTVRVRFTRILLYAQVCAVHAHAARLAFTFLKEGKDNKMINWLI